MIEGIGKLFCPFLQEAKIDFRTELVADAPAVYGSIASLESVLTNLITNSLNAFGYEKCTASGTASPRANGKEWPGSFAQSLG